MTNQPFFIDTFRKLLRAYDLKEISISKFVETLNAIAHEWATGEQGGPRWVKATKETERFTSKSVVRFIHTKLVLHEANHFIEKYPDRIETLEYLDESSPSAVAIIHCTCKPADKHGTTDISCCNECGLPDDPLWRKEPVDAKVVERVEVKQHTDILDYHGIHYGGESKAPSASSAEQATDKCAYCGVTRDRHNENTHKFHEVYKSDLPDGIDMAIRSCGGAFRWWFNISDRRNDGPVIEDLLKSFYEHILMVQEEEKGTEGKESAFRKQVEDILGNQSTTEDYKTDLIRKLLNEK